MPSIQPLRSLSTLPPRLALALLPGLVLSALVLAALLLVGPAAAGAQETGLIEGREEPSQEDPGPAIQALELHLSDRDTREDLGVIAPGDTLRLAVGQRVGVRLVAIPAGRNRAPRYPSARFSVLAGDRRIDLDRHDPEQGSVVVVGVHVEDRANPDSTTLVEFEVLDPLNAPPRLQGGTFTVVVEDDGAPTPLPGPGTDVGTPPEEMADEMTRLLYESLLMREPDPGARSTTETIERQGWEGVLAAARSIANSEESRDLGRRGVRLSERLAHLYEVLLDSSDPEAELSWDTDIQRLGTGALGEVTVAILTSDRFARTHGVTPYDGADDDRRGVRRRN